MCVLNYSYDSTVHSVLDMHENFSRNIIVIFLFPESCVRQTGSYINYHMPEYKGIFRMPEKIVECLA
jgi:hypothetical protein